jgi:uncharacterized membrane protein
MNHLYTCANRMMGMCKFFKLCLVSSIYMEFVLIQLLLKNQHLLCVLMHLYLSLPSLMWQQSVVSSFFLVWLVDCKMILHHKSSLMISFSFPSVVWKKKKKEVGRNSVSLTFMTSDRDIRQLKRTVLSHFNSVVWLQKFFLFFYTTECVDVEMCRSVQVLSTYTDEVFVAEQRSAKARSKTFAISFHMILNKESILALN